MAYKEMERRYTQYIHSIYTQYIYTKVKMKKTVITNLSNIKIIIS